MSTPEDIIREALTIANDHDGCWYDQPFAALDKLVAERDEALFFYNCRRCIDALRHAGCRCVSPLLGHRPGVGPRCRLCNTEADDPHNKAEAQVSALRKALQLIAAQQPATLKMIESNGFVFDDLGKEPGNWQHLAFTIYTDLCRVETIASAALNQET